MEPNSFQMTSIEAYLTDGYYAAIDREPIHRSLLELEGILVSVELAGDVGKHELAEIRKVCMSAIKFGYNRGLADIKADPLQHQNWRDQ